MSTTSSRFLTSTKQLFTYYKSLGEKAMGQLSDDQLFYRPSENDNSIAIIVGHLYGNMMSRWTDFLISDGEKDWRQRDLEFEPILKNRAELEAKWAEGWTLLFSTLENIKEEDLMAIVFIRNMGHSVLEALNRQLAHYAYHIGQIVFYAKMLKGHQWESLSIPKGKSESYNAEKFSKPKHKEHFTDEFIRRYEK